MLVLFVIIAVLCALLLENAIHHMASNYEIEWACADDENGNDMAQEIARTLRESERESERQMNRPFKVASDATW